jgi:hypothetical protein
MTFPELRSILVDRFGCSIESIPAGAGMDNRGNGSPPIYAFFRETDGDGPMMSTIVVTHEDGPILLHHLRSFLRRLGLTIDDVLPPT